MSEWPGSGRGTRTQFRLGPAGGFLRGIHPVRGDIMDVGPAAAAGISADLVSSNKGTRTRTVREYEQTISELKKENFDLKLKIYMSEEGRYKNFRKDKDGVSHDKDNSVQVMVQLKLETESLQIELNHKDNLLREAKYQVEKYELSVKELSQKCQELQSELALLSEVPTKEEFSLLLHEKENLLHLNNTLEKCLQEKREEIEMANHRIEVLATVNESLEEKKKKRNAVLQSFVIKDIQEKELLPDEIRTFAISAVQAAKNGKKEDLVAAVKNFNAAVSQVLASSVPTRLLNSSENGNSQHKCLEEECAVEQRCLSLPGHNNATDLSGVQSFKEFISVKGTPLCPEKKIFDCFIRNSFLSGTVSENCMAEKDVKSTPVTIERASLVSLANGSERCSSGKESGKENSPPVLLEQNESIQNENISTLSNLEESLKFQNILNENVQLKEKLEANLVIIEGLRHAYEEIKSKLVCKEAKQNATPKASGVFAALCQRDFSLCDERNGGKLSDWMAELREDTLLLLLTIDGKNKEISNAKQMLCAVQADLEQALNNNQTLLNEDCVTERNELHERLSYSCTVNMELMRHLRNLETFMEGLLQNRLDSSLEGISDRSSFFSNVSKCLNESLKLSNVLSDHLSICEGSKIFEESQCKNQSEEKSVPDLDVSETSVPDFLGESNRGTQSHLSHLKETFGHKDFEMFYGDTLCRKCLQQLNSPLPKLTGAAASRFTGYPSSESDIWSEPDRDVSMQRIGINLQVSPTSTKSPRKLRSRDQRRKLSTDHNTSSSDVQHSSRLRRNGSACRRLFGKDISENRDFILEKYHFLISEKFSRLGSLLASMEDIQNDNLNTGVSNKINSVMTLLGETLQKLQIAKAKSFSPATCGKCAVLELLLELKTFPEHEDECKSSAVSQFFDEILSLKELCDEPFSLLPIGNFKVSKSIQSDPTTEQDKICELEKLLVVLKDKNDSLCQVQDLISKEKGLLETVEAENLKLAVERKQLKELVSDLQNNRNELLVQNAELVDKLTRLSEDNSEMNHILLALEQSKKESSARLDQLADELRKNKSELVNMSIKCVALEKELNEQMKEKEKSVENFKSLQSSSSNAMEKYVTEIHNLNLTKKDCTEKLEKAEEKILRLEKEIAFLNGSLNTKNNELKSLLERVELLQNSQETLSATCVELQSSLENSEAQCLSLQEKCCSHIQEASQRTAICEEYHRQLQQAAEQFSCEKRELIDEISSLTSERDTVVQKLKFEKDNFEKLMAEKMELNQKLVESCQQIATLRSLKEKLAGDCASVLQENKYFQDTLLSSDSKCVILGRDLVQMRDTLLNLELKCVKYEKELVASAGMRKSFIDCLLNIRNVFARTGQEMLEICKSYDIGCSVASDEMSSFEFMPVIDEDNVECLCDNVSCESKKLLKTIDAILEVLKGFPLKLQEVQDKYTIKIKSIRKQMELQKREMEHLQSQNDFLKGIIEEKRKLTSDNEKLVNVGAFEIQSLKEKLHNSENEIEKEKLLLKAKDDEITNLQEHLFNLQTYINSMLLENSSGKISNGSMKSIAENSLDSVNSFSPQLPESSAIPNSENPDLLADDSSVSASSTVKNSCCEKYFKKCHLLQKKLSLSRKQIQILEDEKASLREFQSSNSNLNAMEKDLFEDTSKISDMESKLERKKNFITELKGELLKACNALIDREREVDSLKIKLSKYETKCTSPDLLRHISTEGPKAIDTNIKNLTNYKWTLIQSIFGVQRSFYEEKGIHLNYFDQFKDHVNTLFSLQLAHALSKSESLPLLSSFSTEQGCNPSDYRFKHLVGLELDIECLENLKIFFNRFFVPCVTQPATVPKSPAKVPVESKLKVESEDKSSVDNLIFNVSQHIDNIKDFFTIVEECEQFKSVDFASSDVESVLLLNILSEATKIREGAEVLFKLNALLKEVDPKRFLNKPDVSDQESVLSEETITISRSETPLSTDDLCPVKLSYPPSFKLKAQHLRTESRELVSSGKSCLLKAISSSCDSIHHRSQYSSPDLGIESDPNHEGSIPEQKDSEMSKYQKFVLDDLCPKESTSESSSKWKGNPFVGDQLYSIGTLPYFELLKREIQESLVGIKSVLSRTGDGLHHIGKHTSPRKTLESNTMKAIKDTCANIEVCLKEAYSLVGKFWTAHCPSEREWNALVEENERLYKQLTKFKDLMQNQENEFKKAMGRLEHAQLLKASMEKKISKKLVKTKKVIRQAELKLLENRCQNCPPVPKYPSEAAQSALQERGESSLPKN